jgi:hypothetical protein
MLAFTGPQDMNYKYRLPAGRCLQSPPEHALGADRMTDYALTPSLHRST